MSDRKYALIFSILVITLKPLEKFICKLLFRYRSKSTKLLKEGIYNEGNVRIRIF